VNKSISTMAQQIAQAASAFEQRVTGHAPKSVTVVMCDNTMVITLHGALSPAEKALAQSPEGAARVQEFHRQLFTNSFDALRLEIKGITGVDVREASAEVETTTGTVVKAFATGTVVQVFLLAGDLPTETWSSNGQAGRSPAETTAKHASSEHHFLAAAEHEVAAQQHRQAAHQHDRGNHAEAQKHARAAHDHSQDADRHSKTAHVHSQK
jgi:uncharacterized protein YbcI